MNKTFAVGMLSITPMRIEISSCCFVNVCVEMTFVDKGIQSDSHFNAVSWETLSEWKVGDIVLRFSYGKHIKRVRNSC